VIKWWPENIKIEDYDGIGPFNPDDHEQYSQTLNNLRIVNCKYPNNIIPQKYKLEHLSFTGVIFPNGLFRRLQSNIKRIVFTDCVFFDSCTFDYHDNIEVFFKNCLGLGYTSIYIDHSKLLSIENSFFNNLNVEVKNCTELKFNNSSFKKLTFSPYLSSEAAQITEISGILDKTNLNIHIDEDLTFYYGLKFKSSFGLNLEDLLIIEGDLERKRIEVGNVSFFGGDFENGIQISSSRTLFNPKVNYKHKLELKPLISSLFFQFGRLESDHINCSFLNVSELSLKGINNTVPIYLLDSIYKQITLKKYQQDEKGLVNFRNIANNTGLIYVDNTLILNGQFFFQNSELQQWKSVVRGSLFKFHALLSKMPENFDSEINVDEKLETINTWLLNSNKESDIINWSELKKKQWKVLWEKRKNNDGLTFGQKIQKATQWTNDYGTKWQRAFWLYLGFNFMTSVLVTFHNVDLIHCYLNPCQSAKILCDEFQVVFANFLYPLSKPKDIDLIFVFVKVINAVLLVQLVAAFRGYFRGR
jgi:hypothetical protein